MGTVGPYTKILYRRDRRPPPSPTMLWAWELDKIFLQTPPHFHFPDNSLQTPPPVLGAMEACSVLQAVARAGRATSSVAAPRPSPRSGTVLRTDLRLRPSRRTVVVAQAADGEAPAEAAPAPAAPRAKPAPKGASAFSPAELEASLTRLQSNKLDLGKLKSGLGSRASPELTKMLASFDEYQSQVAGVLDAIHGKAEKLQEQEVRKEGEGARRPGLARGARRRPPPRPTRGRATYLECLASRPRVALACIATRWRRGVGEGVTFPSVKKQDRGEIPHPLSPAFSPSSSLIRASAGRRGTGDIYTQLILYSCNFPGRDTHPGPPTGSTYIFRVR